MSEDCFNGLWKFNTDIRTNKRKAGYDFQKLSQVLRNRKIFFRNREKSAEFQCNINHSIWQ